MKKLHRFIPIVLILALFGCQSQQPSFTDEQKETVKKEVSQQFETLTSAIRQINATTWSENYSQGEFVSAIVNTDYYSSRQAWVDTIAKYFAVRESQTIDPVDVRVTPLAPDLALMVSRENVALKLKDGKNLKFQHAFTMVWKKEKDGWKILHSHESVVENPAK